MHVVLKILIFILIFCFSIRVLFYHRVRYQVAYYHLTPTSIHHYVVWPDEGPNANRLQDLEKLPWPNYKRPALSTSQQIQELQPFEVRLSSGQYATLEQLLEVFQNTMVSLDWQSQWFISGRTLLGSIQHHDIIPWDDGIELYTHVFKRASLQSRLGIAGPKFKMKSQRDVDLLYMQQINDLNKVLADTVGSLLISETPWPYITIRYYENINPTIIRESGNSEISLNLSDIFPVTYRPLGKHWYPAPRRPLSFLKSLFYERRDSFCSSLPFSRALEKNLEVELKECHRLMNQFCFVQRCPVSDGEMLQNRTLFRDEYLVDGNGKVVHKLRTVLDPDQTELPFHNARHKSFTCP